MGILNITPDSFFSGSRVFNAGEAEQRVFKMIEQGADIIDIGAMSTRPGSVMLSRDEEWDRLEPVLELVRTNFGKLVFSLDTVYATTARRAVEEYGVAIINDISAGEFDAEMFKTVAKLNVPYIIMHMRGTPETMQSMTDYDDMFGEIIYYFSEKIKTLNYLGVNDIIIDPGFGFSKTVEQNFELLDGFERFQIFEMPVLAGLSRKTMIWKTLGIGPDEALNGTTALNMAALMNGANILRVHDVKEARETIKLYGKLKKF
ncbi:MAG: dihydropteroate synthase [Bacteroidales bacterium]|nr:dihydropteroate synthase [Bacteroidales bacterium]